MNFNIVFMPISVFQGMAGTLRLQNLILNILKNKDIQLHNIIIQIEKFNTKIGNSHIDINKIKKYYFSYNIKNPISILYFYYLVVRTLKFIYLKNSNNVIYNYGYPNIQNILILFSAKLIGYKIVFDIVEDNSCRESHKSILNAFKNFTSVFLFKHLNWFANGAIGISKHLCDKLRIVSDEKFPIIHLPISINKDYFFNNNFKYKNKNEKFIFYGGSFGNKDGLWYLLKAFDRVAENFPRLFLKISGRGSERDQLSLYELISQIKNSNKVILLGFLSYEEYLKQLQNADILCMTRIESSYSIAGFPFKLGEMLASGNPVIATNIGDVGMYLKDKQNSLLISPGSYEKLSNAIEFILSDYSFADRIGRKGKLTALKYFNAESHSNQLLNFLKVICNS